jgi:hypothetical protein
MADTRWQNSRDGIICKMAKWRNGFICHLAEYACWRNGVTREMAFFTDKFKRVVSQIGNSRVFFFGMMANSLDGGVREIA